MKVHQVVFTFVDFAEIGSDGIRAELENARFANDCIVPHVRSVQTRDIGEWYDEHPLNLRGRSEDELRRLFGDCDATGEG